MKSLVVLQVRWNAENRKPPPMGRKLVKLSISSLRVLHRPPHFIFAFDLITDLSGNGYFQS